MREFLRFGIDETLRDPWLALLLVFGVTCVGLYAFLATPAGRRWRERVLGRARQKDQIVRGAQFDAQKERDAAAAPKRLID